MLSVSMSVCMIEGMNQTKQAVWHFYQVESQYQAYSLDVLFSEQNILRVQCAALTQFSASTSLACAAMMTKRILSG